MRKRWVPALILSVPVITALLLAVHIDRPLQIIFRYTIVPIQAWIFHSKERINTSTADTSVEYVTELEEENTQLKIENAQLRTFVQESGLLEEQIQFLSLNNFRSLYARIISRTLEGERDAFVLNRGSIDGVQEGLAVITASGVCIGVIDVVNDTTSTVRLLSDSNTQLSAVVQNGQKSQGIVTGSHQLSLEMTYIPLTDQVDVGNTVITSGVDALIPRGLVIGSVSSVSKNNNELFQSATLEPLFLPQQLSILSIVLP